MKLLLCNDVEKLGWLGDIVEVKEGYARNYLLPQGLAIVPTAANVKSLADEKARRSERVSLCVSRKSVLLRRFRTPRWYCRARPTSRGICLGPLPSMISRKIYGNKGLKLRMKWLK